ncbi:MAG: hypothetical protein ACLF0G_14550 [Candidatus Brocadiia bacterium]
MAPRWARQLALTVAVEADDPAVVGRTGSYRSLDGLERLHGLCRGYAVRPTYLLTWSAAGEPRCVERMRAWADEAEVGGHLHPEEVPPVAEAERGCHTLRPGDVEPGRLRAKLANLVERVAQAAGRRPTAYRAGFLGITPAQVDALAGLGVEADSSLGPLERTREGYPYLRAPRVPYVLDGADVCRRGRSGVVEVPLTSVFARPFPRALAAAYLAAPGRVRGALRRLGLAEVLRFRPAAATAEELVRVCERTERLGVPAVMSIHSNELAAGTSGGVRTEAESEAYFARLERVLAHVRERGWRGRTLTEMARDARGGRDA